MAEFYVRKNASGNGVFSTIEEARDAVRALIAEGLTEPVTVMPLMPSAPPEDAAALTSAGRVASAV